MTDRTNFDESDRKGREQAVSRRDVIKGVGAGLAAAVGLAGATQPVAAEQGAVFDFYEDKKSGVRKGYHAARGRFSRWRDDEDKRSAPESAEQTTTIFNRNADTLVSYANEQLVADREKTSYDTIRLIWSKETTVERWIVADVDQDANAYVGATMTDTEPASAVDEWVELEGLAAADLPDELERFVDEYAEPGRPVDEELDGRLTGKYAGDVEGSLI